MSIRTKHPIFQATGAFDITPSDDDTITTQSNGLTDIAALYIGTGGDVAVETAEGQVVVFKNVPDGTFLPVVVKKVRATDTVTADDILGLYTK